MIDVHSHILPNIDDGSKELKESIELIKEAKEAGFDAIISTSHYMENYYEADSDKRKMLIDEIQTELKSQGIEIKIYLGNEIYLSGNTVQLIKEGKASTINSTDYVLFEMPLSIKPLNLYEMIYKIQNDKKIPILAHPERYSFVQDDPELIYDLIERGVLMQSNFGSVIGLYGKKAQITVKKFLTNNMVHMLGSDVHRMGTIYKDIPYMLDVLEELIGEEKLIELTENNPRIVLNNEKIVIEKPKEMKKSFWERIIGFRK